MPGFVISYSEIQFSALTLLYYGVMAKWFLMPLFGACLSLYLLKFRRIPKYVLAAGVCILFLDLIDGFRISWGFVQGDPYLYDPYTNLKEVAGWAVVCFAAFLDSKRVGNLHRIRGDDNPAKADGVLGK